jgi:hypothetical protein
MLLLHLPVGAALDTSFEEAALERRSTVPNGCSASGLGSLADALAQGKGWRASPALALTGRPEIAIA